jgi:potassium-dependent mechanosensitive channel
MTMVTMQSTACIRVRASAWIGALLLGMASTANAAIALPSMGIAMQPGKERSPPAVEAKLDPKQTRARIERELETLQALLDRDQAGAAAGPPGVTTAEVAESQKTYATLSVLYEGQLDTLKQLEESSKTRQAAEKAGHDWTGFTEKQAHSILLLDTIREEVDTHRAAVALLGSSRGLLETELEQFRDKAQRAQEAARHAVEAVEAAPPGSDARAAATWRLEAARAQATLAGEFLALGALAAREFDERLATSRARLNLAERKSAALAGKIDISKDDVAEAHHRLDEFRRQRDKELQSLLDLNRRRLRERDVATRAVAALRAAEMTPQKSAEQEHALKLAEARLRAADVRVHCLGQQIRILTILVNVYHDMVTSSWDWRYVILTVQDPDVRQKARGQLAEMTSYLKSWSSRASVQLNAARSAIREQDQRLQAASDPEIQRYERDGLDALRQLQGALERQQTIVTSRLARLGHWEQEFTDVSKQRPLAEMGADLLSRLRVTGEHIWNYELLTFEDKVEIGGKIVTTSRGVTVGKSIGAILLFLLGCRLLVFLSARIEKVLVRRFGMDPEQGKTLRRWANALGVLVLLLLTLNIARIPLTVFAFAGGALAIGIGFGTQTIIKNLISGLMVLLERQVRVGDVIEVEGVTGIVSAVNIRSSMVRGFDGVESMIPNAMLLEQKVTNWTLSNRNLRRVIKVGVAYGSPSRDVERILAQCAQGNKAVLERPAPWVVLDDFGSDAVVFALYFWLTFTSDEEALRIVSDLRFAIEEQLAGAGITIAFPQRDVHLDVATPLQVEMIAPRAMPG